MLESAAIVAVSSAYAMAEGTIYDVDGNKAFLQLPDGYAGLAFRFLDSQDWTPYEFVEVTISFEDKEASCDFGVRDITGEVGYVRLGGSDPSSDIALTISGKQQTAKIPLATNFKSVNQKVVYELIFNTDSYSHGDATCSR
jgi:hypothetical protein